MYGCLNIFLHFYENPNLRPNQRDQSLISGMEGYNMVGGQSRFIPTQNGGKTVFSHAEGGGGTKSFGVVLRQILEVLAVLKGMQKVSTI